MKKDNSTSNFKKALSKKEKIHYIGDLRIIGQVMNEPDYKKPIGFVIMNEKTNQFKMYNISQTYSLLDRFKFVNAEIIDGKITNTECSMKNLPKFNRNMKVVDNFGIIILGEIKDNGKKVGYRAMDTNATIIDISEDDLIKLYLKGTELINAKVVTRGDKKIVSAIKSSFTEIIKTDEHIKNDNNTKLSEKELYRHKQHIEKYNNYFLPKACKYIFGLQKSPYNDKLYSRLETRRGEKTYLDFNREIRILLKEVFVKSNGYNLSEKDRELFKKIVYETEYTKYVGYDESGRYTEEDNVTAQKYIIAALCQFALYNKSIQEMLKVRRNILQTNTTVIKTMIRHNHASDILLKTINSINSFKEHQLQIKKEAEEVEKNKEFKTKTFTKASEEQDLGFATSAKLANTVYLTSNGYKKKLLYLGDVIENGKILNHNYNIYKNLSRCLGDILVVAYIHKLMDKYLATSVLHEREYLPSEDIKAYIEILIAISYIYNSEAVREFVEDNKSELKSIGVNIPDYDELSSTDYKLSPQLNLYFTSGFNVFYNDKAGYRAPHLKDAELINYRQIGVQHEIKHNLIYGELASIITMVTSCPAETVSRLIGKLRFL